MHTLLHVATSTHACTGGASTHQKACISHGEMSMTLELQTQVLAACIIATCFANN